MNENDLELVSSPEPVSDSTELFTDQITSPSISANSSNLSTSEFITQSYTVGELTVTTAEPISEPVSEPVSEPEPVSAVVYDSLIIKEQIRDHSFWLQTESEKEYMKHHNKNHNILLNKSQYIDNQLVMGSAECKTCKASWNMYSLDNAYHKVILPLIEQKFVSVASKSGSIFDTQEDSLADYNNLSQKKRQIKNLSTSNDTSSNREVVKIKII